MTAPSPTRPSTADRRRDLATRLLDIAERQIAEAGLAALRARSLAEAAGCAVGAIYGVYPDLDELILLVNARTLDAIEAALDHADPHDLPAPEQLVRLAGAYLDYAASHRLRWDALFAHRMAGERPVPDWYRDRRHRAFLPLAAPLATLCPHHPPLAREALGRALFAAVHGVVSLGLEELLGPTALPDLRDQLAVVVSSLAAGLAAKRVAAT